MSHSPGGESNPFTAATGGPLVASPRITKLQVNLGLVCNLACRHCHVESSPVRTAPHENMNAEVTEKLLDWVARHPQIETVDLTGGSPEMNPHFKTWVETCRQLDRQVMDRCNPTILVYNDPKAGVGYSWVAKFLATHRVEVVASMPCYLEDNVVFQRGKGSYNASVEGLLALNRVGYGRDPELKLQLVYNPNGPHLPPAQARLEEDYRRELADRFGLVFNELWTIANMPIQRWRRDLEKRGQLEVYEQLLASAFNPSTVDGLMCRHQVHVDCAGHVYDCDFNYALDVHASVSNRRPLWEIPLEELQSRTISTGKHCFGCTAGAGSSCGGQLVELKS